MWLQSRVQVQHVTPQVDCGRYAAKAVVGDRVVVGADAFRDGHELVAVALRHRGPGEERWRESPMRPADNPAETDRWYGDFGIDRIGRWRYQVVAWTDDYASWLDAVRTKHAAGQTDLDVDLREGAALLRRRPGLPEADRRTVAAAVATLDGDAAQAEKVAAAGDPELLAVLERHPERRDATRSARLTVWVDRERGRFGAWYEMFPRSEGATGSSGGTLADAAKRLPAIADMGFDVVYLPPIHPIGRTNRKGRGPYELRARPDDPGVPWAIGSAEGGHTAVHPDLGTIEDFDEFVAQAGRNGLEVALDYAVQCSPDHPWVTEHPEWFKQRPDGTIKYAENPPKRYEDIYPVSFDTHDIEGLTAELRRVMLFWIGHGVRIFRVDNPHTKALPFWEWLIGELHCEHPDVVLLAEAFTRPKMMRTLAKLGFTQSYTYFAWRNTKRELTDYVTELAHTDMADYFRPSFWPNTPDILTEYLQTGGRPAFKVRLLLAATLSPSYGIYSGYELCEDRPLHPGSEEYLHSEKYRYRPRDWSDPATLAPFIARVNRIRREHGALRTLGNVWFHHVDGDDLLCYSKVTSDGEDRILVVANLDPHRPHDGMTGLDLWQLGLEGVDRFQAHDLLTDATYEWHGPRNYVRLDPLVQPAHVLRLRPL
ncbi:alpha-1,4-glucan--maltose-1-phosphate maltosyltransferase [soil metagenome]